ncbi:hypothetical protein N9A45_01230 [bacterium]|nr:hypothetical protein [bacterium]
MKLIISTICLCLFAHVNAIALLNEPIHINTYVLPNNVGCKEWLDIISSVSEEFPSYTFHTIQLDLSTIKKRTAVPYTETTYDGGHAFRYQKSAPFLRRWLSDIPHHRWHLQLNVTVFERWYEGFPSWIHVLSEKPTDVKFYAKRFLQTGFAWSENTRGIIRLDNAVKQTMMIQPFEGPLMMKANMRVSDAMRLLFPPIIPASLALNYTNYMDALYVQEIHIHSRKDLDVGWLAFQRRYPKAAFIHFRDTEHSGVWTMRRTVQYEYDGTDPEGAEEWYEGIRGLITQPVYRLSAPYKESSTTIYEATGNTLRSFLQENYKALVYLYDSSTVKTCEREISEGCTHLPVSRMNVTSNDHESLPVAASAGEVYYYINGSTVQMFRCEHASEYLKVLNDRKFSKNEL